MGCGIPEAAGVRRDLVSKNDLTVVAAELDLEVDEVDVELLEEAEHELIYLESILGDGVDLLLGSKTQTECVVAVDERIAEVVVLVAELEGRSLEGSAFLNAELLGKAACCDVSYDNFQRNDLNLLNNGLAVVDLLDKVGRDTLLLEKAEHVVCHLVINNALAVDLTLLQTVESGSVVLVGHHYVIRVLLDSENLLSLAFVKLCCLCVAHGDISFDLLYVFSCQGRE